MPSRPEPKFRSSWAKAPAGIESILMKAMIGVELILMKAARGVESIQARTKAEGYHLKEEPTATVNEDPQC
jgi:hypothetical protein